jgi:decaprenylphospho-beta-D-ribofuranose 2-oxidase
MRRVDSAYIFVDYYKAANLEEALAKMETSDAQYEHSVAWIDALASDTSLGRCILMNGNHASASELPSWAGRLQPGAANGAASRTRPHWNLPGDFPSGTLNRLTVKAFNSAFYAFHSTAPHQVVSFEKFFYPLDAIDNWNRMYGKRGFVQYQIALPEASGRAGLRVILERVARSGSASFLAVLKRFGEAGPGLLSFPLRGYTLALDIPARHGLDSFLHELDRITLDYGGRVYLAKDAVLRPGDFAAMYPKLDSFRSTQRRLDPKRLFSSSLARRLKILD